MLPLRVKPPVAVEPEVKQELVVVKFRFVMLTLLPLLWVSVTVKLKAGELLVLELMSAAVQFPLMVLLELDPHPASTRAIPSKRIVQTCFIRPPTPLKDELPCNGWHYLKPGIIGRFHGSRGAHCKVSTLTEGFSRGRVGGSASQVFLTIVR